MYHHKNTDDTAKLNKIAIKYFGNFAPQLFNCVIKLFFFILLSICLACCGTAVKPEVDAEGDTILQNKTTDIASPIAAEITRVQTATVLRTTFYERIESNGILKAAQDQIITAPINSKIISFNKINGQYTAIGTTLLLLETTAVQYRLQRAQISLFNSKKEYESQLLGYEALLKDRTVAEAADIKKKLQISAGLTNAEQEIKEATHEISEAQVKATFTGVLADIKIQQGQMVAVGQPLLRMYNPHKLLLEIKILEADIALIKIGCPANVTPLAQSTFTYAARVVEVNPIVDENGMVNVKLEVVSANENNNSASPVKSQGHNILFPGMNCTALIKVPVLQTLLVPKEAVVMRNNKAVVFTVKEGKAFWNYITVGRDNGKEVEITKGLVAGQTVITTNNLQLAHDAPVIADTTHNN